MYRCAACGDPVVVLSDGKPPIKRCGHDAAVIAEAEVRLQGRGGVNDGGDKRPTSR